MSAVRQELPSAAEADDHADETQWVDSSIRWDAAELLKENDNACSSEGAPFDPFADPDPTDTFSFRFLRPVEVENTSDGDGDGDNAVVEIDLQGYKPESDQIWNSTGLTLWRAAEYLGGYLAKHADLLQNKRIIELGAGLGLCGILAAKLMSTYPNDGKECHTASVFLTDGDTDAMAQLRENVRLNIPPTESKSISCRQLLWGHQTTTDFLQLYGEGKTFDVLLASDVVYVQDIITPLFETVQVLLSRGGFFLFSYCTRRRVDVKIESVLTAGDEAGFSHKCVDDTDGILTFVFRWKVDGGDDFKEFKTGKKDGNNSDGNPLIRHGSAGASY